MPLPGPLLVAVIVTLTVPVLLTSR